MTEIGVLLQFVFRVITRPPMADVFKIYALSDATGDLAQTHAASVVNQFPDHECDIVRVSKIKERKELLPLVKQAREDKALIIFTFVSSEMRVALLEMANEIGVVAIDILGPTLDALTNYLHTLPSTEPGLQYKLTQKYFKRTEAVEFTVKHDDGLGLESIDESDVILLGISRTSKTPLSIYMAYHGYRCANMPLVNGIPLAKEVLEADRKKMIGLTIDPRKLATIRSSRLRKLGRSDGESYASLDYIISEIKGALSLFQELKIPVIDVTGKAIEETATEIITLLGL